MAIIRTSKKEDPYARISRHILQDRRLTWEARGFAGYLFSKPGDWEIDVRELTNASPSGRDVVYRIINELIAGDYMVREKRRDQGRFNHVYNLFESKQLATEFKEQLVKQNPTLDFSQNHQCGKPVLVTSTGQPDRLTSTGFQDRSCKEEQTKDQTKESQTKDETTTTNNQQPVVGVSCEFSESQILSYARSQPNMRNPQGFAESVLDGTAKNLDRSLQSIREWLAITPPRTTAPLEIPVCRSSGIHTTRACDDDPQICPLAEDEGASVEL